ncbi:MULTISPECIES: FAD-binding oxidoreductase [unclassified Nocardioides]|uniref:FAD-binding oxidoreductase n=1 Tax=unclassified Nocardioides TaxID=2615069 RepID=UPI00114E5DB9|nr:MULTISPECIES: FAD-binding oxidoreductase [unclassified Nocardioides]TQK71849.1 FAD/FMN-containing dehydrogenase [Nocardioides sp. SLBN-35]WGY03955.1 FAD-binding oxidoreductase [Nocardioides sp. QY071]
MANRSWEEHARAVQRLSDSYAAIPAGQPVRLAKRTTNLFRARAATTAPGLDVSGLAGVIEVLPDGPDGPVAEVQGMCTYEDLVDATLPHGLVPHVVPQLRTITLGGAVTGLGIESTSFRLGLPHESVLEMDVFTGSGQVVTTRPGDDLFDSFPNSYGSLGYATRLRIKLAQVPPYVALRHLRIDDADLLAKTIAEIAATQEYDGEPVHGLDGVSFGPGEHVLTLARWTDEPGATSDYAGQQIYYRSLQTCDRDRLTFHDYLWRWDTDWFWCSGAFGAQNPRIRRFWPRRYRRSDVYMRMLHLDRRFGIADRLDARAGRPLRERVVQDIEVPVERLGEFLAWFDEEIGMRPVWLCPLATTRPWPLYPLEAGKVYVNVGFWGTVHVGPDAVDGPRNRAIEAKVHELGGHKSLYSDAFYDKDTFDALYNTARLAAVKRVHDPDDRLTTLYDKAVRSR